MEVVVELALSVNSTVPVVVKSTVPVGYTCSPVEKWSEGRFLFSQEFLREGHAPYDNLHPLRIVVGVLSEGAHAAELEDVARSFVGLLREGTEDADVPTRIVRATEAEAVKIFENIYLALRLAYFNELDTNAEARGLDASQIIECVGLDSRIGPHYNNPSFGCGGYCLPKETKQLLANYDHVPQILIGAIMEANRMHKGFVAAKVYTRDLFWRD